MLFRSDIAKYMDDPQLIIYGLIKKTEQVKNDPELTGAERDEEVRELRTELEKYTEEYELLDEEGLVDETEDNNQEIEPVNQEPEKDEEVEAEEKRKEDKKEKEKSKE